MTPTLLYRQQPLRIALAIWLILLIGFKVMTPVFKVTKGFIKEVTLTAESEDNKTEKGSHTDHYDKNKEFNNTSLHTLDYLLWYTNVNHTSEYAIDYKSSYYDKITIPPPEFCLQHHF